MKKASKTARVTTAATLAAAAAVASIADHRAMLLSEANQRGLIARLADAAHAMREAEKRDALAFAESDLTAARQGTAGVIQICGILNKVYDWCGLCSTSRVMEQLNQCVGDDAVSTIILDIDSPGGFVNGSVELADAVAEANKVKPVVAVIRGYCCSGAFWIACQAGKIICRPESEVGNIGVYSTLADVSAWYESMGIELTTVASGQFKGLGADGRVTDDLVSDTRRIVTGLYNQFVDAVAAGRQLDRSKAELLSDGKAYLGEQAKTLGLVDAVASTFGAAIQIATTGANAPGKEAGMGKTNPTATTTAAPVQTEATTPAASQQPNTPPAASASSSPAPAPVVTKKSDAEDGDAKKSNEDARKALSEMKKAAAAHKAAARAAKDHADDMTEADDETKSLAHSVKKSVDAAHDEANRCTKAWLSLAGEDPAKPGEGDPDDGDGDEDKKGSKVDAAAHIAAFGDAGVKLFADARPFHVKAAEFIGQLRTAHKTETDALKAENAELKKKLAAMPRGNEEARASLPADGATAAGVDPKKAAAQGLTPGQAALAASIKLPVASATAK